MLVELSIKQNSTIPNSLKENDSMIASEPRQINKKYDVNLIIKKLSFQKIQKQTSRI